MGLQNLCTLFGPTLMKLSPPKSDNMQMEDMNKEIKESMQQAQVLFYILQLHAQDKLVNDIELPGASASASDSTSPDQQRVNLATDNATDADIDNNNNNLAHNRSQQAVALPPPPPSAPATTASNDRYAKLNMQTALWTHAHINSIHKYINFLLFSTTI